ncbi:MAG: hypothetical protein ACYC4R_11830 [Anaerolineae bacterium]
MPKSKADYPIPPPILSRVTVVGVCAAGKSTLVAGLAPLGYDAHSCAQEHSYVPNMWQLLARPQALIYLHVSWPVAHKRRPYMTDAFLERQQERLRHARAHAHVVIDTDQLSPQEVLQRAVDALARLGIGPAT